MSKKVVIIGGGAAGLQAASVIKSGGAEPVIIEKEQRLGGKLNNWHKLFPSLTPARDVLSELIRHTSGMQVMLSTEASEITPSGVTTTTGEKIAADAVIVASGFELFDASIKEEYGYGMYENVYTTSDIERMFNEGGITTASGEKPRKVAFLHCVGSRDEKVNQRHCSRVCCITGVKQAMEIREMVPGCEVFNFYMDIRMFGPGYEELYREAQERYNIHFIRGRISEAAETIDKKIQLKAEDTLLGRPLKMTVDMLILIIGMTAGRSNRSFSACGGIKCSESGFLSPRDCFSGNVDSDTSGIFYAGTVTAPKNVGESINEGTAAAMKALSFINGRKL